MVESYTVKSSRVRFLSPIRYYTIYAFRHTVADIIENDLLTGENYYNFKAII